VVIVAGRGEVIRNFLFSDTLPRLAEDAEVTVLSVVDDEEFLGRVRAHVPAEAIVTLADLPPPRLATYVRTLTENAHDRWLWSAVARNNWELRDRRARQRGRLGRRRLLKLVARALARRPALEALTALEQALTYRLRPTRAFDDLFARLRPDLVFNGSHIHGQAAELPLRVAHRMGLRTAGFVFSWDNLTSRSRIFVPYDDYLVWNDGMRRQLLEIYPRIPENRVHATGTPQFDYHFKPEFRLPREELCRRIGVDPGRPFVLYTTGIDNHFFDEHLHVERVAKLLAGTPQKPQLVVRTYVKGTSAEMKALARRGLPDVAFPPVGWHERWHTPHYDDLAVYTSLLLHCALGVNAASTVSLELMIFDKPIVNLRFDPPGSELPWCLGYERHILFDHFRPVAESGATMVARSDEDLKRMLTRGLSEPLADSKMRREFLSRMFGDLLDGRAGRRVAERLLTLARNDVARKTVGRNDVS
jgi:hypothetical protein